MPLCAARVSSVCCMQAGRFSEEQVAEFRALAADPDVYDKLTAAVAPSIWELDDVKRGILCQVNSTHIVIRLAASFVEPQLLSQGVATL